LIMPSCRTTSRPNAPDFERTADRTGEFWSYPRTRTFGELLIDCERIGRFGRCSWGCCGRPIANRPTLNDPA
jgi:hypothetical protein